MMGIQMDELRALISTGHEVEFTFKDNLYIMQPEIYEGRAYLAIWDCTGEGVCIYRHSTPAEGEIPQDVIDNVFNEKCFSGKTFKEIEGEVTVKNIY
jgi:hypothetical protein